MTLVTGPEQEAARKIADRNVATGTWQRPDPFEHYPGELTKPEPDGTLTGVSLRERNPEAEAKPERA